MTQPNLLAVGFIMGTIYDLTYTALKVQQNTGRGEVKRNPCIEFADV